MLFPTCLHRANCSIFLKAIFKGLAYRRKKTLSFSIHSKSLFKFGSDTPLACLTHSETEQEPQGALSVSADSFRAHQHKRTVTTGSGLCVRKSQQEVKQHPECHSNTQDHIETLVFPGFAAPPHKAFTGPPSRSVLLLAISYRVYIDFLCVSVCTHHCKMMTSALSSV